jgi:hypothetical protein
MLHLEVLQAIPAFEDGKQALKAIPATPIPATYFQKEAVRAEFEA